MQPEIRKNKALSQIKNFCELTDSQIKNLEDFIAALLQENEKFNFIGKSTIEDLWSRHVLDSAQLLQFIDNKNLKFADFGSGAGFPGIVLSALGLREIHLVEKSFRKADFLRRSRSLSRQKIFVHQTALEEFAISDFDCIVSRALAPLPKLLEYASKFLKKDGYCLFLKGKNLPAEIVAAKNYFSFDFELHPSLTSSESSVIKVSNINPNPQKSC